MEVVDFFENKTLIIRINGTLQELKLPFDFLQLKKDLVQKGAKPGFTLFLKEKLVNDAQSYYDIIFNPQKEILGELRYNEQKKDSNTPSNTEYPIKLEYLNNFEPEANQHYYKATIKVVNTSFKNFEEYFYLGSYVPNAFKLIQFYGLGSFEEKNIIIQINLNAIKIKNPTLSRGALFNQDKKEIIKFSIKFNFINDYKKTKSYERSSQIPVIPKPDDDFNKAQSFQEEKKSNVDPYRHFYEDSNDEEEEKKKQMIGEIMDYLLKVGYSESQLRENEIKEVLRKCNYNKDLAIIKMKQKLMKDKK